MKFIQQGILKKEEEQNLAGEEMLNNFYFKEERLMKYTKWGFLGFILSLMLGICVIFAITKENYSQTTSFLQVQGAINKIIQNYILITKEVENLYLIQEAASQFPVVKAREESLLAESKSQLSVLFEQTLDKYNALLTLGIDEDKKRFFDQTYLDQRLEVDPSKHENITLIQALNNIL